MHTVAIVSRKGGAGKTTLAVHLAAAAERSGQKSAILDLDQQAAGSNRTRLKEVTTSTEALRCNEPPWAAQRP